MELILFIGHHKVGSTALQAYLARESLNLLRHGVLYPAVESEGLMVMLRGARQRRSLLIGQNQSLPMNYREGHNALAFRMMKRNGDMPKVHANLPSLDEMKRTIAHQISYLRPRKVILAAEVFSNFGPRKPQLIRDLVEMVPGVSHVHVISTLRRIDDYLVSWYGQRLKFGTILKPLSATVPRHYKRGIHLDYRQMLEPWIDALPAARFTIQTYDDVLAAGGAIPSFLKTAGLPGPRLLDRQRLRQLNASTHPAATEFLRRANIDLPKADAERLQALTTALPLGRDLPQPAEVELFGAEARRALAASFAPVQAWLSKVTDRTAFFPPRAEIETCRAVPEHKCWETLRDIYLAQTKLRQDRILNGYIRNLPMTAHF